MTVLNAWEGIPSSVTAPVVAKIDGSAARLAVWDNEELDGTATFYDPDTGPTSEDIVRFVASDLDPNTRYWWQVEVDAVLDTSITGTFRTLVEPGTPFSFTMAASGCANGVDSSGTLVTPTLADLLSNGPIFDTIREAGPLFFAHLGDLHYYDLGGSTGHGSIPAGDEGAELQYYRTAYDDVLLQDKQHQLYYSVPLWLSWDDHDYGPNNSDRTHVGRENAQQAFAERVPFTGSLPGSDGQTFQAHQVGRVLFASADTRSDRSPNADPDNASKTMLGTEQKTWLRGLLESSDAELFVWLMPSQWIGRDRDDTWDNFTVERDELVQMFTDTGWIDRMCIVGGDLHDLAIDTGTNSAGGIPVFQFASLDSSHGNPKPGYDTGLTQPGRDQWGTLEIVDDGSQIRVTGSGWIGTSLWDSHTIIVGEAETEPEPGEPGGGALPQVAQARITTRLTWLSCNLSDGAVITELPDLQGDEVSRVIGEYTSANLSLPIPAVGARDLTLAQRAQLAIQSTQPPRTKIVAVVNDVPAWEGIPLPRDLGTDAEIPLGCVSMEGYLRHVYITDHAFNEQDVALIADGILRDAVTTPHGPGIAMTIDAPNIGATASRSYLDIDDQTVFDGLSELMDAGLIEWTLEPDWRAGFAYRIVDTIARVRGRLGRAGSPQAVFQSATFSSQGASDARYALKEDYSGDRYANVVRLTGTGEGVDQPRSAPAINQDALDAGVPVWELRDSAPQTVKAQALLDLHAERRLDRVRSGAQTLEITARWDAPGARLGVDWRVGDDVRHELRGTAHPNGLNGVRRAIGFALSIQRGTIRPILQEDL